MATDKEKTPYEEEVDDSEESEEINRDAGESGDEAVSEQAGTEDEDAEEDAVAKAEKKRLKEQAQRKAELLKKMQEEAAAAAASGGAATARRDRNRLAFLTRQAELFQHFAPGATGGAAGGGGAGTSGKKGGGGKKGSGGRRARDEGDEDAELLRDEDDGGERAGHRLQVQPSCLTGGTLREYQMQGLNWLIHLYDQGINGILADEMGLGKTLQTISLLAYLREFRKIRGPHLIIVPKSTLGNWMNEIRRFCPAIEAVRFHGNAEQREATKQKLSPASKPPFDAVVTSYEMVIKEKAFFRRYHWRYVIIDEAHRIKNENSVLSRVVRLMRTDYRLLITGTPLQNNLHELWALLNFLLPEVFSSSERFEEWFGATGDGGGAGGGGAGGAGGDEDEQAKAAREAEVVSQLHKVLRPFLLRRLKADVERGLPPKKETILKIGMSEMQRKWYKALLQKDVAAIDGSADRARLLNVVMQLRKCCNHPYLFEGAEPGPPYVTGEHLVDNSGKMVLLDKLLPRLKERGSRVLIFSQMTRMLDVMEDYCLYRGYRYCRIDGNTGGEEREAAIDSFNAPDSEQFVFLLSTRAGGLGINLATADVVVLYDSDWNPQMDLQAMDRAHRIGQKKEVQVFRFCTEHSIEEKVIEKAYKKLRLDALVIQQGRLTEGSKAAKVNKDDLLSMVRYGAELVFSSEAASITDADIEAILKKGETDTALLNEKMQQFTDKANKAFALDGGLSVYDYKDPDEEDKAAEREKGLSTAAVIKAAMAENWADPGERKRKRPVGSYSEAEYFRQAGVTKGGAVGGGGGGGGGTKGGKGGGGGVKVPAMQDFQFFDAPRITELYEKENRYLQRKPEAELEAQRARAAALARGEDEAAAEEQAAAALAAALDGAEPLTEQEVEERRRLQAEGFGSWTKKDFNAFVRACERHGRGNLAAVAADVEGKGAAEVERYSRAFWARLSELGEHERVLKQIERGEQKIQRQADIMTAIRRKLAAYRDPWQELRLAYGQSKGRAFTEEEDRFLLCTVDALGYGQWEELKAAIRLHWRFRFDWFFKSRTAVELARRCDVLVRLIERENEEAAGGGGGGATAGGAAPGAGARKSVAFDGGVGSEEPEAKRSRPGSAAPAAKAEA